MSQHPAGKGAVRAALAAACLLAVAPNAVAADRDAVARGAYLAGAAGCEACHTDRGRGGQAYAGGLPLATEFGTIPTPNITPDPATGLGRWSMADFARAVRWGIAPMIRTMCRPFLTCSTTG